MSHMIISEVEINLPKDKFNNESLSLIKESMEEQKVETKLKTNTNIRFFIEGSNAIDYEPLLRLYIKLKKIFPDVDVTALEYVESSIGFDNGVLQE